MFLRRVFRHKRVFRSLFLLKANVFRLKSNFGLLFLELVSCGRGLTFRQIKVWTSQVAVAENNWVNLQCFWEILDIKMISKLFFSVQVYNHVSGVIVSLSENCPTVQNELVLCIPDLSKWHITTLLEVSLIYLQLNLSRGLYDFCHTYWH